MNKHHPDYYQIAKMGSEKVNHPSMRILMSLAQDASDILDLGCGEGTRLNLLVRNGVIGTGVDIDEDAIASAKSKYKHNYKIANLEKLPFNNETFDLIYSAFVFEHLTNPKQVIKEALRVLSNGGHFLIVCPNFGSPNRASPPYKGSRIKKLFMGIRNDFFVNGELKWNRVKPISTKNNYEIDWDTTIEPYLGSLIEYCKKQGFNVEYLSSCWEMESTNAGIIQKIFRFLGERNIYPFKYWGPHLLAVIKKGEGRCNYCGNDNYKAIFKVQNHKLYKCLSCGLVKTSGISLIDYSEYHRDNDYEIYQKHFKNIFEKLYSRLINYFKTPGKILEVGCSTGTLLTIFQNHGWETWGVEPSKSFWAAQEKGIRVLGVNLLDANLEENSFDLIVVNHTLEHMADPKKNLEKAFRLLKKGGKIFVGVPNFGSIDSKLWGRNWKMLLPDEHKFHFTSSTLGHLLEKTKFKILDVTTSEGIWSLENPFQGLMEEFKNRKKAFIVDLVSAPFAGIATIMNKGSNLMIIAEK